MSLSVVVKKIEANNRSNNCPSPHRSRGNTRTTNAPAIAQQPSKQRKQNHNQLPIRTSANRIISNQEDVLRINPSLIQQLPVLDQSDQSSDYNTLRSKYNVVPVLVYLVQQGNNYIPSSGNDEYSSFSNHSNTVSNLSCPHCKRPFFTLANRQNYKAGGVPDQTGTSFSRQPIAMININSDQNLTEPAGNLPQGMGSRKTAKIQGYTNEESPS